MSLVCAAVISPRNAPVHVQTFGELVGDDDESADHAVQRTLHCSLDAVEDLDEPVLRARARHVVTENERVAIFAKALATGDYAEAGQQMLSGWPSGRARGGDGVLCKGRRVHDT